MEAGKTAEVTASLTGANRSACVTVAQRLSGGSGSSGSGRMFSRAEGLLHLPATAPDAQPGIPDFSSNQRD